MSHTQDETQLQDLLERTIIEVRIQGREEKENFIVRVDRDRHTHLFIGSRYQDENEGGIGKTLWDVSGGTLPTETAKALLKEIQQIELPNPGLKPEHRVRAIRRWLNRKGAALQRARAAIQEVPNPQHTEEESP